MKVYLIFSITVYSQKLIPIYFIHKNFKDFDKNITFFHHEISQSLFYLYSKIYSKITSHKCKIQAIVSEKNKKRMIIIIITI